MKNINIEEGLTLNGVRVTQFTNTLLSDPASIPLGPAVINAIAEAVLASGSNVGEIYNVRNYGGVPNAVVPASGNVVTGTDNKAAFDAAIAAAPSGAFVYFGAGNWLCSSLEEITSKKLMLVGDGNIYTNGQKWLTFSAPGGRDRHHMVFINGRIIGKVNYPTHSKTNYDNGTTGNAYWAAMTGSAILINQNVNGSFFRVNEYEGFKAGIEMVQGGGNGSQENIFAQQRFTHCAYPIYMRSTDGVSWCDKNYIIGLGGGKPRVSGHVAIKIDGFSGNAPTNNEAFNGAFRSNEFALMIEAVSRVMESNGDITEPRFDVTIEGGVNTGVFDVANAIQCRSISPNFVRAPKWCGQGFLAIQWLINLMGIEGKVDMEVWNGGTYIGNRGRTDSSGNLVMEVRPSLSKSARDAAVAILPTLKFVNHAVPKVTRTITGSTTLANSDAEGTMLLNMASGTVTAASASSNVDVGIDLINIHASATATIANVTGLTNLGPGKGARIVSDGVSWRAIINP